MRVCEKSNIGDTEQIEITRTRKATDALLALLQAVHPVEAVPEPKPAPKAKKQWFSMVGAEPDEPQKIWIDSIQRAVSDSYGVTKLDLVSERRTANVVRPRQVAMYLARTMTTHSMPEIGRRFGKRDHTTVIHAYRKIERLRQTDRELAARIDAIKSELRA